MISSLIDWLVQAIDSLGYLGVALAVFLETFIPPIPSQIIFPFSGFVASQGTLNIVFVILTASLVTYLGTLPFYLIGLWGEGAILTFLKKYGKYLFISNDDIDKAYKIFDKHGHGIIFFGRVIPIIRSVISLPAGVAKMNFWKFTLFTLAGTTLFAALLCLPGYFMGENWGVVVGYIEEYERVILALLLILFLLYIRKGVRDFIKERNSTKKDS
ncbi:MAG: DedA family protein [Candidatus Dojkabacteria bacterium]|jgi:membrane protein DedA with SNARE-associated domain|nr:DedA family protein [Candidatus Dojkabacteria bacterium]MDD4561171.1 DedA family protein [Candidatus Dojkabacteria bacterium]